MADILIKNIGGLPEDGNLTLTITPKGEIILGGCVFTYNFGKEVKAVAFPEHGRLKDTDFMLECLEAIKKDYPEAYKLISGVIERTPTVLEASE